MSTQLLGNLDANYEPGVAEATIYDSTPLQDQIEQADDHISKLEDALEKTVDVISALLAERLERKNDVYQAQLDAQDWQNKYNEAKGINSGYAALIDQRDAAKAYANDRERLLENCRDLLREECLAGDQLRGRIQELTDENKALAMEAGEGAGNLLARVLELTDEMRALTEAKEIVQNQALNWAARVTELTRENTQLELAVEKSRELNEHYLDRLSNQSYTIRQAQAASKELAVIVSGELPRGVKFTGE